MERLGRRSVIIYSGQENRYRSESEGFKQLKEAVLFYGIRDGSWNSLRNVILINCGFFIG